jgi:membrane fusion protein (multidrug efflux system)
MFLKLFKSLLLLAAFVPGLSKGQPLEVVEVRSEQIVRTMSLPGEILPFQHVSLQARINGYVERILVDRGSVVKQGQLLVTLAAPELTAQVAEAESRMQTAEYTRAEAEARLAGLQSTNERLKNAAATPGAIAGNELVQAEKAVDAGRAAVRSAESAVRAAKAVVDAAKQSQSYLNLTAPFSGIITERNVHPGALVGPGNNGAGALLELAEVSRLRLVVPVPEAQVPSVRVGTHVDFRVPAYPGRTFRGTVARVDRSLDAKTRTMPVEVDVVNSNNHLSPGMYPEVVWPVEGTGSSLLVPQTAVVTTTERTFVIRIRAGRAEWVSIRRGQVAGDWVQVMGDLRAGETIVRRGTDEIREGTTVSTRKSGARP